MRPLFAFIAILVIGGLIAVGAYDAGLSQAVVQTAPAPGTVPVAYYPHPYGWGFGFFPFGFLFPLIGIFIFFGLLRALFWGGRGYYGHRGWYGDGQQHDVPSRFEDWHKRAHGDTTARNDQSAPPRQ